MDLTKIVCKSVVWAMKVTFCMCMAFGMLLTLFMVVW